VVTILVEREGMDKKENRYSKQEKEKRKVKRAKDEKVNGPGKKGRKGVPRPHAGSLHQSPMLSTQAYSKCIM